MPGVFPSKGINPSRAGGAERDSGRSAAVFLCNLTLAILVGTLLALPPFNWPLLFATHLKDAAAVKYGEPPYGHAELSRLDQFARKTGLVLPEALAAMKEAGIRFDSEQDTLQAIARRNNRSPQDLFHIMQGTPAAAASAGLPADPPPGTGQHTLATICQRYALPVGEITGVLQGGGLKVQPELTLKEIGAINGLNPMAVYDAIREAADAIDTKAP